MKKIAIVSSVSLLLIIVAFLLKANSSKDKPKYSCDPNIDAWVEKNKAKIETLTRLQVGALTPDSGIAVLHCMSPEHKYLLWKEKMIAVYLSLTDKEKPYFKKLMDKYSIDIYKNEKSRVEFEAFSKKWYAEVQQELGWSDMKIYLLTNILATEDEMKSILASRGILDKRYFSCDGSETCCCIYSISCNPGFSCVTQNCGTNYRTDCGIAGTSACTGRCQ